MGAAMRQSGLVAAGLLLAAGMTGEASISAIERQRLLSHMAMTSAWLMDEVAGLSDAQLAFKPSRAAWSIAQVLDHLVVVAPIYWEDLQRALAAPPGDVLPRDTDASILWYGIDRTNREDAIPAEVPQGKLRDLEALTAEYWTHHHRLRRYVTGTTDDLRRHLVARQGSDAYQWILLISTHEQRHILQIRDIKTAPGFPAAKPR
jgi:uncharacterized damage-inducible protein DinB